MRFDSLNFLGLAPYFISPSLSVPLDTRAVVAPDGGDIAILNYAWALEYLERQFYTKGLQNYIETDFCNAGFSKDFYQQLTTVKSDEMTHVNFSTGALGEKAIEQPTFSFPVTDAHSFVGLSAVLEGVVVSASLGAAPAIANKNYLSAAGSILTIEARHASYISSALGQKPFPLLFDTPLDLNQVFFLAAQFVTGLAPGTDLPFKAFPPLKLSNPTMGMYHVGSRVILSNAYKNAQDSGSVKEGDKVYAVFHSGLQT